MTPGKKLLGLQVVKYQTGEAPGFGTMLLRDFSRIISGLFFGLGYFWALFDKNGQAWHDKIAGTVVLKRKKTEAMRESVPTPALSVGNQVLGTGLLHALPPGNVRAPNEIYLYRNEQQQGPYTEQQLREMVISGEISQVEYVWYEGLAEWQPLNEIISFSATAPAFPPPPEQWKGNGRTVSRKPINELSILVCTVALCFIVAGGYLYFWKNKPAAPKNNQVLNTPNGNTNRSFNTVENNSGSYPDGIPYAKNAIFETAPRPSQESTPVLPVANTTLTYSSHTSDVSIYFGENDGTKGQCITYAKVFEARGGQSETRTESYSIKSVADSKWQIDINNSNPDYARNIVFWVGSTNTAATDNQAVIEAKGNIYYNGNELWHNGEQSMELAFKLGNHLPVASQQSATPTPSASVTPNVTADVRYLQDDSLIVTELGANAISPDMPSLKAVSEDGKVVVTLFSRRTNIGTDAQVSILDKDSGLEKQFRLEPLRFVRNAYISPNKALAVVEYSVSNWGFDFAVFQRQPNGSYRFVPGAHAAWAGNFLADTGTVPANDFHRLSVNVTGVTENPASIHASLTGSYFKKTGSMTEQIPFDAVSAEWVMGKGWVSSQPQEQAGKPNEEQNTPTGVSMPGERHPETRMRLLVVQDIQRWNNEDLRYAINEMYARHGADFKDKEIKKWFSTFNWYHPRAGMSYDAAEAEFSDIEKQNVKLLGDYRGSIKGKESNASFYASAPGRPNFLEEIGSGSRGKAVGISYVNTPAGRGAVFSRVDSSRIEYSFENGFPMEGTLEWRIKVNNGYGYANGVLSAPKPDALIFTTVGPDTWYPGCSWLTVNKNGTVTFNMADSVGGQTPLRSLTAMNTGFSFDEWHTIGISFGSDGRSINVDGRVVAHDRLSLPLAPGGTPTFQVGAPTIGEMLSRFWPRHQHDSGFDGVLDSFRTSSRQDDWKLCK